jgi:DNA excision repair protein ERCC-8
VFIPEGSNIASLDVNTGKSITRLRGHYHGAYCTTFNEQTQELFSGGGDKNILVWESNQESSIAFQRYLKSVGDDSERGQKEKLLPDGWSSSDDD